jgi:hypothetical protein
MKCEEAVKAMPLFIYGELSFDVEDQLETHLESCADCRRALEGQRSWMTALDQAELEPTSDLLIAARQRLRETLAGTENRRATFWDRLRENLTIRLGPVPTIFQPVGALALVLMGFLAARLIPPGVGGRFDVAGLAEPMASRVKYVEQQGPGKVQIVLEETRQRTLTGKLEDQAIQRLLLGAAKDPADPGLRVESVSLLRTSPESYAVRNALLYALQHDTNSGVRLKALEGLKASAGDPEVRQSLAQVLLTDKNPGVRTQVIDLLIQRKEHRMVGVLQELMRKEDNNYVRLRCQRALHDMNASIETY